MNQTREFKTWPEYFQDVSIGAKRCEIRRDDRGGFLVGDVLHLREFDPNDGYTGRELTARVTHVMVDSRFVVEGFACLSIEVVKRGTQP